VDAHGDAAQSEPYVAIALRQVAGESRATVTTTDNAGGIPSAKLPLIFEPYYTSKPPERGTGLGLFVVRQIATAAGGDVAVESHEGLGTTFTITMPLAGSDPALHPAERCVGTARPRPAAPPSD
jgi:signal transduction histidine kinase